MLATAGGHGARWLCRGRSCQKSHVACGRQKNIRVRVRCSVAWVVSSCRRSERDERIFLASARPGEGFSYAGKDRSSVREVSSRGRRENERENADVVAATTTRGKGAENNRGTGEGVKTAGSLRQRKTKECTNEGLIESIYNRFPSNSDVF